MGPASLAVTSPTWHFRKCHVTSMGDPLQKPPTPPPTTDENCGRNFERNELEMRALLTLIALLLRPTCTCKPKKRG